MTVAPAPHLRTIRFVILGASLLLIGLATLSPEPAGGVASHFCLICGSFGLVDAILNVLLFVPLGIAIALAGTETRRALIAIATLSLAIEATQFFLIAGRDSTIGDVITNTLGGAAGFTMARHAAVLVTPNVRWARILSAGCAVFWVIIQGVSSYAFVPTMPRSQYYAEVAPTLGNYARFRGQVLSIHLDDLEIRGGGLPEGNQVRQRLLDGAGVDASVIPEWDAKGVAPIVRIVDDAQREILVLAQHRDLLVFGAHTGATDLKLRPPMFALPFAFAPLAKLPGAVRETVFVSARYGADGVTMESTRSPGRAKRIQLTQSMAWSLLLPFQWLIEGTFVERTASWVWMGTLLIPVGFWSMKGIDPNSPQRKRQSAVFLSGAAALLVAGLALVPRALGGAPAPIADWAACVTGLSVGYAIGQITPRGRIRFDGLAREG
jgi:hypothetical protein